MLKKILCAATLLCAAGFTNAATITHVETVNLQKTDYALTLFLPHFNDMGGTRILNSVTFSIFGSITGDAKVENEDADAQTLTTTLSAVESLIHNTNTLVVTIPTIINTFNAAAYDGMVDFMGSSGITYNDITASQFESQTHTDSAILSAFTGTGTEMVTFDAMAASVATGAGNITSSFNTKAEGIITVTYDYDVLTTAVSAPSQIAFLGLGLVAFAGLRKTRK